MTDLVERLRQRIKGHADSSMPCVNAGDVREAASTIEALSERIAVLKGAVIEAKLARLNWQKYNAEQGDEVVYQAEKMALAIDNIVNSLTPDLSQ